MTVAQSIKTLQKDIFNLAKKAGLSPDAISLLAVSKGQSVDKIKQAIAAGLHDFAESYLQEAQNKMAALSELPIAWHFIGPVQSNKCKAIARDFSWVHSVSRAKIAKFLNDARPENQPPLNICLQINFGEEAHKSGMPPEDAPDLIASLAKYPQLRLRGLMTIPPPVSDTEQQYLYFARLKELFDLLNSTLTEKMDTLSMGMSSDWPAAIRAGSTMIRIGTAIFGERQ